MKIIKESPEDTFTQDVVGGMDIIDKIYFAIEGQLKKRNLGTLKTSTDLLNHINAVAKGVCGIDDFRMEMPDEYEAVYARIKEFLKKQQKSKMTENKKVIKEAPSQSIPTPKSILNYKDDEVVAAIKKEVAKNKDFEVLKIMSNANQYYNVVISYLIPDEDWSFELDKYRYMLQIHKYRTELFTELSKVLPVVNVNMAAYEFVKGNEELRFALTILLSDTNNRDWVTGRVKKIDQKERNKLLQIDEAKGKRKKVNEDLGTGFEYQPTEVPGTPTTDEDFLESDNTKSIPVKESELVEGKVYQLSESNGLIIDTVQLIKKFEGKYLFEKSGTGAKIRINGKDISKYIQTIKKKVITEGWKMREEIPVIDAFKAVEIARQIPGVLKVNAITQDKVSIVYDGRKIDGESLKIKLNS